MYAEKSSGLGKAGHVAGLTGEPGRIVGKSLVDFQTANTILESGVVIGIVGDTDAIFQPCHRRCRIAGDPADELDRFGLFDVDVLKQIDKHGTFNDRHFVLFGPFRRCRSSSDTDYM